MQSSAIDMLPIDQILPGFIVKNYKFCLSAHSWND